MSTQIVLNSFEEIYNETYNNTLRYIMCKCANFEDVNDILQDTYMGLYKILEKNKKINLNNVNSFIIGIAKNKLKDYYGLKYKIQSMFMFSLNEDTDMENAIKDNMDLEEIVLRSSNIEKIWDYINTKKTIIGKIFYLYYYFDMTTKNISKELSIKESTVKSHLYRTLKELSIALEKEGDKNV